MPPLSVTHADTADTAPLRMDRVRSGAVRTAAGRSMPLIRVRAENSMTSPSCAAARAQCRSTWYFSRQSSTMDFPSGVSSARLAASAADARVSGSTPGAAISREACRLP